MRPNQARLGAGVAALAGLWIAVYWWWEPSPEPAIRFDTVGQAPHETATDRRVESRPGGEVDQAPTRRAPVAAQPPQQAPALPAAGVLPPDFYEYVVEADDASLEAIAQKLLGDRSAWVLLAQSNPLKDPARLKAGQVWRVPLDEANLQGVVVDADGRTITASAAAGDEPADPPPGAAAPEEFVEYVVQSGDSLSVISQRLYGTQRHADLLFELNRRRLGLRSADSISVGQTLRAPKSPPQ